MLSAVRALLSEPNGDDGLVEEVAHEFRHARRAFDERARAMTRRYAMGKGEEEEVEGRKEEAKKEEAATALQGKENAAAVVAVGASSSVPASKSYEEREAKQQQQPPSRLQLGVKRPRGDDDE